jgi:hypothetical protein
MGVVWGTSSTIARTRPSDFWGTLPPRGSRWRSATPNRAANKQTKSECLFDLTSSRDADELESLRPATRFAVHHSKDLHKRKSLDPSGLSRCKCHERNGGEK